MSVGVVTAVCGVVTAVAAVAIVEGWSSGPWTERVLLLLGTVIVIFGVGGIVIALAVAGVLRTATFFAVPEQPPGLNRISAIIELQRAEQDAWATGQLRERHRSSLPPSERAPATEAPDPALAGRSAPPTEALPPYSTPQTAE